MIAFSTLRSLLCLRQDRPDAHRYRAAVLGILESKHTIIGVAAMHPSEFDISEQRRDRRRCIQRRLACN